MILCGNDSQDSCPHEVYILENQTLKTKEKFASMQSNKKGEMICHRVTWWRCAVRKAYAQEVIVAHGDDSSWKEPPHES